VTNPTGGLLMRFLSRARSAHGTLCRLPLRSSSLAASTVTLRVSVVLGDRPEFYSALVSNASGEDCPEGFVAPRKQRYGDSSFYAVTVGKSPERYPIWFLLQCCIQERKTRLGLELLGRRFYRA